MGNTFSAYFGILQKQIKLLDFSDLIVFNNNNKNLTSIIFYFTIKLEKYYKNLFFYVDPNLRTGLQGRIYFF
jgi:hypothetical protein